MKDFIQRNTPVFMIGLITVVVFLIIIVTASKRQSAGPKLQEIKNEQLITKTTPVVGLEDARVVVVEFSDFECPACKAFEPVISSLIEKYKDRVLFAYKHMPLAQHTNSQSAAIAAEAAHEQGKFWEYGSKLFEAQPDFSREKYIEIATGLGLDVDKFTKDLDNETLAKRVEEDRLQAVRIGLEATPSFIINNSLVRLTTYEDLEKILIDTLVRNNVAVDLPVESSESSQTTTSIAQKDTTLDFAAIDKKYGIIKIDYTEDGFSPVSYKAIQGQLVRWTNKTDRDMVLAQIIHLYDDVLGTPLTIKPGKTFELRLTKDKLWTYKETSHAHYAGIFTVAPEK